MGCGCKNAEGGCGCGTKKADTATVEEPDWIPDGDGRAIGQQDFAINLSPLHADTVGKPSPTFNEDITGQDGPSDSPTNATFEARRRYGPSKSDMDRARARIEARNIGTIVDDRYLYSSKPSKKTGEPADKYYYVALTEDGGKYYVVALYGGSKRSESFVNVMGGKESPNEYTTDYTEAKRGYGTQTQRKKSFEGIINHRKKRGYNVFMLNTDDEFVQVQAAETLAEIEGPTAEATSGGLHAPSSFAMTWEDGAGYSSASIPPNEIAWAETSGIPTWVKYGAGIALLLAGGSFLKAKMSEQKAADNVKSAINKRKGCGCGSKSFNARSMNDPIAEDQDRQNCVSNGCEWVEADPMSRSTSYCKCHNATAKEGGIQNSLDGGVTFQSEFSVGQINPVEVEGQNDVYGAEDYRLSTPQISQPNWGPQKTYRQNQRNNLKMW